MTQHTLLIVDDEPGLADGVARNLRRHYARQSLLVHIHTFTSPADLLAWIDQHGMPTAVVTDDRMPGAMWGRDLAKALRDAGFPGLIVMLSGTAADDDATGVTLEGQRVDQLGVSALLTKPAAPPTIAAALQPAFAA